MGTPPPEAANTPLVAVRFAPAIADTKSAILSRLDAVPSESRKRMLSLATFTVATVRSLKFSATVTAAPSDPLFAMVVPPLVALATVAT